MSMNGYVKNASPIWMHAMKRSIGPGAQIPLDELYEQYGVKHNLKEGEEFIHWLRNVKLKDALKWKIILQQDEVNDAKVKDVVKEKPKDTVDRVAPFVTTKHSVADIVGLSVRKAREVLPHITDLTLLKYAFQEANQLSGKDSLCRILRKRIRDLQIAR